MEIVESMCYCSTGCNCVPHCLDWGKNGLVCFGSCNEVVIYQPDGEFQKSCKILQMLKSHKSRVNCVRWIQHDDREVELLSTSVDKTIIVWRWDGKNYVEEAILRGHTGPVTVAAGRYLSDCCDISSRFPRTFVVSASSDSTFRVWIRNDGHTDFDQVQKVTFGTGFVLDLHLILIPDLQTLLLACGCDDCNVHLYVTRQDQFMRVMTLGGHEDWVRGVNFTIDDTGSVLLSSCGQDGFIRLWSISRSLFEKNHLRRSVADLSPDDDIRMKENTFSVCDDCAETRQFAVVLESVFSGHDGWVFSARWHPHQKTETGQLHQPMRLLSASMDKTMIIWSPDELDKVWVEQVRVGEVGGNTLGLYGGVFSPDGLSILAHDYQGALRQWIYNKEASTWGPAVTGGGHTACVEDIMWQKGVGSYLISASCDQTCRLHAPWIRDGRYVGWYKIARPQIHGYDMHSLAAITPYMFASAGDEKVSRVFQAPRSLLHTLSSVCGLKPEDDETVDLLPNAASLPALSLSNKSITQLPASNEMAHFELADGQAELSFMPICSEVPPNEEHLIQNTLWPEIRKLYGHGYEVFTLASNSAGTLLASACKANKAQYANILIWDTSTWQTVSSLDGCSLTVIQMAFSPSDDYLLAVSRDRTWSLYSCGVSAEEFKRVSYVEKMSSHHTRIIWACCWSYDGLFFFTASRDKKIMAWSLSEVCQGRSPKPVVTVEMVDSVTAIDSAPVPMPDGRYLLASGLDSGHISLHLWLGKGNTDSTSSWSQIPFASCNNHQLTVKRLRFRPVPGLAGRSASAGREALPWLQLASCGADHSLKVHNINCSAL